MSVDRKKSDEEAKKKKNKGMRAKVNLYSQSGI
jgi:hypothetical protein